MSPTTKQLHHLVESLGEKEKQIFSRLLHRKTLARDTNEEFDQQISIGNRIADKVAAFGGSWTFIIVFLGSMGLWMAFNTEKFDNFDPYPLFC